MVGTPGEEITPLDFVNPVFESVELDPPESAASIALRFNHGYTVYVDNAGSGGNSTRWWLDAPDLGEVIIGPRSGSANLGSIRLRTSGTTATAANVNMDASGIVRRVTSSLKYKTDVQPHQLDLEALRKLRVVTFTDKAEIADRERRKVRPDLDGNGKPERRAADDRPAVRHLGLIAEEVDDLGLTEFVVYGDDGKPDALSYDRLVLGALQLIGALEGRVRELERQLAAPKVR